MRSARARPSARAARRPDIVEAMSSHGANAADAMSVRLFAGTPANATLQDHIAAHDSPHASADKAVPGQCFYGTVSTVPLNSIDLYRLDLSMLHACYRGMLHACCRNILDESCIDILHKNLIGIVHIRCSVVVDEC